MTARKKEKALPFQVEENERNMRQTESVERRKRRGKIAHGEEMKWQPVEKKMDFSNQGDGAWESATQQEKEKGKNNSLNPQRKQETKQCRVLLGFWIIVEADCDAVVVLMLQETVLREARHRHDKQQQPVRMRCF